MADNVVNVLPKLKLVEKPFEDTPDLVQGTNNTKNMQNKLVEDHIASGKTLEEYKGTHSTKPESLIPVEKESA